DRLSADSVPGFSAPPTPGDLAPALAAMLFQSAAGGMIDVHWRSSTFATSVSTRPRASAVTRERAPHDSILPTLQHRGVKVSDFERLILTLLDGTRTRDDLLDSIDRAVANGSLSTGDNRVNREAMGAGLDVILKRFAAHAILEA
ncbi:MAG TPA: hypothetical protein VHV78_15305, partial [Gemmatimonadaceae bacterium]|nr:hypothetical protein [Gemmatimonadaceae bacterium]